MAIFTQHNARGSLPDHAGSPVFFIFPPSNIKKNKQKSI